MGCSRTLVHHVLPDGKLKWWQSGVFIGDTVLHFLALIALEVEGNHVEVAVALSSTLPMLVLLRTDIPELAELLVGKGMEIALAVANLCLFLVVWKEL